MFNKTKFPGKPSKLVNKKRVSVLSDDNNFDKRTNDRCEIDSEKNLASPKHEHGYQEVTEGAQFCIFAIFFAIKCILVPQNHPFRCLPSFFMC